MRYLLYYPGEDLPFGKTEWWVTKFCGWYGVQPVALTCEEGELHPRGGERRFYTIEDAVADERFHGQMWVWLDPNAEWTASQSVTMNATLDDRAVPFDDVYDVGTKRNWRDKIGRTERYAGATF